MTTYYLTIRESNSSDPYARRVEASSLDEAKRQANEWLAGCVIGEGYVQLFDRSPGEHAIDPVAVLNA